MKCWAPHPLGPLPEPLLLLPLPQDPRETLPGGPSLSPTLSEGEGVEGRGEGREGEEGGGGFREGWWERGERW